MATQPKTCPHCGESLSAEVAEVETLFSQKRDGILASIEAGNTITDACAENDVLDRTYRRWMEKGMEQRAGDRKGRKYADFADAVQLHQGKARARLVNIATNAAEDKPEIALRMLEALDPATWAPKLRVLVADDRQKVLKAILDEFSAPEERPILRRFIARVAGVVLPAPIRPVATRRLEPGPDGEAGGSGGNPGPA